MRHTEAEDALAHVPFFAELRPRDLKRLAKLCIPKHFDTGAEIIKEGSMGLGLFLITRGRVEVFRLDTGRRQDLAILGDGDVLGEMALIDDKPRSASAVALEPTSTLLLSRDGFRQVVAKSPAVAWTLVPELAERLREVENRLFEAEHRSPPAEEEEAKPTRDENGSTREPELWERMRDQMLLAPYAVLMSSATGFGASLRIFRHFMREFAGATKVPEEMWETFLNYVAQSPDDLDDDEGAPGR